MGIKDFLFKHPILSFLIIDGVLVTVRSIVHDVTTK